MKVIYFYFLTHLHFLVRGLNGSNNTERRRVSWTIVTTNASKFMSPQLTK